MAEEPHCDKHVLEIWGDFACFSRPEMKVERYSYPSPTPSAARGALEAIYFKPEFRWQIDRIELLAPPKYIALRRNEVKDKVSQQAGPQARADRKEGRLMLHALLDYARQEELAAEPGFSPKTVRWLIDFSLTGRFLGLHDLTGGDRKSKGREFPKCPDLSQPELIGAGRGARHFLVDRLDVIALLTKDGQVDEKLQAKHAYFANLLEQASSSVAELAPLAAALRDEATLEAIRVKLAEQKAKPTDSATLALTDSSGNLSILVERHDWHDWWRAFRSQLAVARSKKGSGKGRKQKADTAESKMLCLLSGELVEPQPTHKEKITGLSDVGGLSMGDALVSFDKEAFRSFGLRQAANAAMGETMVKTYSDALNHLIKHHGRRLAGTKVIHWYSGRVEPEDDPIRQLLEGPWESEDTVASETTCSSPAAIRCPMRSSSSMPAT